MANENKEIGDIVKKCKILLLDIEGTTTSLSFVKDKLFPYAEENVKQFLENHWETTDVKEAVTALRKLALEDEKKSLEGLVAIPGEDASKEDQIEGLVSNVKWQMSSDRKAGPLKHLQGLIWKQGFDKGDIKGHVYDDVSAALELWHGVEGQKVYIYSSGSVQAQKLLFEKSLAGDLLPYIDGHFDTSVGAKQEAKSYTSIIEKIGCKAEEILFLTDIPKEAEAARSAGLHAALVSREGNAPLAAAATDAFAVIHSFAQLAVSYKRKTEPQDEQPAKVPKTDASNNSKDAVEAETTKQKSSEAPAVENKKEELQKMEVDEDSAPVKKDSIDVKSMDDEPAVVVEEVTDSIEIDAPISDAKPIVTEVSDKPEETEKMETDVTETSQPAKEESSKDKTPEPAKSTEKETTEKGETDKKTETEKVDVPKESSVLEEKPIEEKAQIAEKTPPAVITEIEEITGDKENLAEMAEIADIEPVVEEPTSGEVMEDLQNVGQELEKECADILTKVQNVTNLDGIPVKQSLKPIVEESADSDNEPLLSENILEKELEIEMKRCEEIAHIMSVSLNNPTRRLKRKAKGDKREHAKDKVEATKEKSDSTKEMSDSTKEMSDSTKEMSDSTKEKAEPAVEKAESYDQLPSDDTKPDKDKIEADKEKPAPVKETVKTSEEKPEETRTTETKTAEEKVEESNVKIEITPEETAAESSSKDTETAMEKDEQIQTSTAEESKDSPKEDKPTSATETKEETNTEEKPKENSEQVNGKTNGDTEVVQNGDASNDDLSTRLSVENGKECQRMSRVLNPWSSLLKHKTCVYGKIYVGV
ncbi:unnamed protein product, partial [Brenthis ino]